MSTSKQAPLKVLFVLGGGGFGGIERHVEGLIRNLDRSEVEPFLCVVRSGGPISDAIAATGVPTMVIGARNGHDLKIVPAFLNILRSWQIDLVHAHELPAFVAAAMWLRPHMPLVSSIHCAIFEGTPNLRWCMGAARTLERRVDRYLPVSQATWLSAQRYYGLAPARGTVFYNPIDLRDLPFKDKTWLSAELGIPPEAPLVGMVGRIADQKDWPAFLEICAQVAQHHTTAQFVAVGDGPIRGALADHAAARALGSRLHWLGFRDDARRIIGALDLFLLTSEHEELPTTLLEAFAMRTPVVGFLPVGGTAEVLAFGSDKCPLAVLRQDRAVSQASQDVLSLLNDPERARCMAASAFQVAQAHFESSLACAKLVQIYRSQMC